MPVEQPGSQRTSFAHNNALAMKHYQASELFRGSSEIRIEHNGEEYRLRITKNGKLILTK